MKKILFATFILVTTFYTQVHSQVTQLNSNQGLEFAGLINPNLVILTSGSDGTLWVSDGTVAGTKTFTNKVIRQGGSLTIFNGKLYFQGYTILGGKELWATDGTDAGTVLVKDIYPGASSSEPGEDRFVVVNNELYFTAKTADAGVELWKTNGTTAGTVMVKDIVPGTASSNDRGLYKISAAGNLLYFIVKNGAGDEVWKSDGTEAGTQMIKDINPGAASAEPIFLGMYQNKIIFSAIDGVHGSEPWISDGTAAGTFLLKDIQVGPSGSSANQFKELNGKMLFTATDGLTTGEELWITDGTTAGTVLVKDIFAGPFSSQINLFTGIKAHGYYYFTAFNAANGFEIWRTDGTTNGTNLFVDIEAGADGSFPFIMTPFENGYLGYSNNLFQGNKFFFGAFTAAKGFELYVTDGTVAGTKMVKDINPSSMDGLPSIGWFYTNNALYFRGDDGVNGDELWRTDGTAANTVMVANINPTANASSEAEPMVIVNNRLIFTADNGDNTSNLLHDLFVVNAAEQVLPININSFTGKGLPQKNELNWTVNKAENFANFEVQKSTDGKLFTTIGAVLYVSTSTAYQFTDYAVSNNEPVTYYRLKLVDKDFKTVYSSIIQLSRKQNAQQSIKAFVNGSNTLQLNYQLNSNNAQVMLSDISGRKIYATTLSSNNGYLSIPLHLTAKQLVVVTVFTSSEILSQKISL